MEPGLIHALLKVAKRALGARLTTKCQCDQPCSTGYISSATSPCASR
jgi:hypothetical protein